jgi:hypothetical protein
MRAELRGQLRGQLGHVVGWGDGSREAALLGAGLGELGFEGRDVLLAHRQLHLDLAPGLGEHVVDHRAGPDIVLDEGSARSVHRAPRGWCATIASSTLRTRRPRQGQVCDRVARPATKDVEIAGGRCPIGDQRQEAMR